MYTDNIKIIVLITIIVVIYFFINYYSYPCTENFNIDNYNVDDLVIIKRTPEYEKLIDGIIDNKKILFTDKQVEVLKNRNQIYNVANNNINNISQKIYIGDNKYYSDEIEYDNINYDSDTLVNNIHNEFKKNITEFDGPTVDSVAVFSNDNYLKNYYKDLYGNMIESNLKDYFSNYYTTINNEELKECIPVKINKGQNNLIIPSQFNIDKYLTNAYNIDYSRIIHPYTIY